MDTLKNTNQNGINCHQGACFSIPANPTPPLVAFRLIPLTQGKFAIVDAENYEWLNQWKWHTEKKGRKTKTYYVARNIPKGKNKQAVLYMHRLIMAAQEGDELDHCNNNALDNRRCNLRFCQHSENMENQRPQKNKTSKYKGVSWNKQYGKWIVFIREDGREKYMGNFVSEIKAAKAYDRKALELFGEFACPNFNKGEYCALANPKTD